MIYQIQMLIAEARGWQLYEVEADSPEEALEIARNGGGNFLDEEIEVVELGEPEIINED